MKEHRASKGIGLIIAAIAAAALLLAGLGGATLARDADGYTLRWWSADGGGTTLAVAGDYVLGGTAGQADAGTLAEAAYTLRGGFWGGAYRETAPRVADLAIEKGFGRAAEAVTFTLLVTNTGPDDVTGAIVSDTLPAEMEDPTWTCLTAGGATCGGGGAGDIADPVDLPAGAVITYTVTGTLGPLQVPTNTAAVIPPAGVADPDPANNLATSPSGYWTALPIVERSGSAGRGTLEGR